MKLVVDNKEAQVINVEAFLSMTNVLFVRLEKKYVEILSTREDVQLIAGHEMLV